MKVLTGEREPVVEEPGVPGVSLWPQPEHVVVKVLDLLGLQLNRDGAGRRLFQL